MKNMLLTLLMLLPMVSFASDTSFDVMSIREIYMRGHMLEAIVTVDRGIRFREGSDLQKLGDCRIKLHELVKTDSILKKGRKINFFSSGLGKFSAFSSYKELHTKQDPSVEGLAYTHEMWPNDKSVTLAELKQMCDKGLRFNVVENTLLNEL